MNFTGGNVPIPQSLLCPNQSGQTQVTPPEQPTGFARLSDAALFRLADNLAALMEGFAKEEKQGGVTPSLRDYVDLLEMQVTHELMRRMF